MKKFIYGVFCCLSAHLLANIGPQGFSSFPNKYFIETGTLGGSAVQLALNEGFAEVRSIEFDVNNYRYCVKRFESLSNVRIYHGDSSKDLWRLIQDIEQPATFWLDAHIFPPRNDGGKNCPLLQELAQIGRHPIKTHTILIDDMHCCGTEAFDYLTQEDLIEALLRINPNYEISYIPGGDDGEYPVNVMVATVNGRP